MAIISFHVPRGAMDNFTAQYARKAKELGISGPARPRVASGAPGGGATVSFHVWQRTADAFNAQPAKLGELYSRKPNARAHLLETVALALR